MRYTSAVVLSTLAAGQAAAATAHNRHASFHARREAAKRENAVDWPSVAYDLKNVNWNDINWSSVFASSAAEAKPTTPVQQAVAAAATPTAQSKTESAPTSAAPSVAQPAQSSKAADPIGDAVTDFMQGVTTISETIGAMVGKNPTSNNGVMWIGKDSVWGLDVTNTGSQDAVFYCWQKIPDNYVTQSIKSYQPELSIGIKPGQTVSISVRDGISGACAPATINTKMANFGGVEETWAEWTLKKDGAFNISKNVNMHGTSISMKGSKCTSDMNTCFFRCKDINAPSCQFDYDLFNCGEGSGGGGGFDTKMQGTGGGCAMAADGERVQVAFS